MICKILQKYKIDSNYFYKWWKLKNSSGAILLKRLRQCKFAKRFYRRFLHFVNAFFLFFYFLIICPFDETWIPLTQGCFVPSLVEFAQRFWRRRIFFLSFMYMYFRYFTIMFPLNKLESPLTKDALCHVWLKLSPWFWKGGFFEFRQRIFAIS